MLCKLFIVGNWKMNKNLEEVKVFIEVVVFKLLLLEFVEVGIVVLVFILLIVFEVVKGLELKIVV